MNLKRLREGLPGADVQPGGTVLERISARITGQARAAQVTAQGLSYRIEGAAFGSDEEAAAYLRSKLPVARTTGSGE